MILQGAGMPSEGIRLVNRFPARLSVERIKI